ncbi:hypothetical protein SNK03_010936 [Fusarium graminearum]|uniref:Chromosome 3, complete genome n=1 Tax=Gibberella zeae (strain ATCC MYA-4620 / CBS 123657 / FGSC 9075 / NRRL 31084 / PH-1) TaxID=229533 RepID=I1RM38_GIBZE|nr:hypothetical protein FGSG_05017 [Fusarium graminearum PH-1]ESU10923.1 hypothetical protein FGSG_05017 [Fusarium graminearum PH-1]CAF3515289.1 unnamed protein product [Fusarium graminearum]CEF85948.1 unnamed protein product [Fusarium graminearum]|eukprot:XP_011323499.1 hypothetical protein FGSG_05017 [Fusarium graminearum PH-1]
MSSVTETFFPRLKEILDQDPSAAQRLKLVCGICLEDMSTNEDIIREVREGVTRILHTSHNAYILPCGHIFGLPCVVNLRNTTKTVRDLEHQCPICRFPLYFEPCGCLDNIGVVLKVEGDGYQKMFERIRRLDFLNMSCIKCELVGIYTEMIQPKLEVSGGVEVEPSEMQIRAEIGIPLAMLCFKKSERWAIFEVHIGNRRHVNHEISDRLRTRLDNFMNDREERLRATLLEPDESADKWASIAIELALADPPPVGMRGRADAVVRIGHQVFDQP